MPRQRFLYIIIAVIIAAFLFLGNQSAFNNKRELGTAIFYKKGNDSQNQVRQLERELTILNNKGYRVGPDHIQWLWQRLVDLWNKKALSRAKAEELYQILVAIYLRSNPQPAAQKIHTAEKSSGTKSETKSEVKEEINEIRARNAYLSQEHYDRLKKELDYLKSQGVSDLEAYYQFIEERSPQAVAGAEKQREISGSQQKNGRGENVCPADVPAPVLTADFTETSAIETITAPGTLTGDRDVAKGHSFIWTGGKDVPIYAPIDAVLDGGAYYTESGRDQYTISFRIPGHCGYKIKFDHIHSVLPEIAAALNQAPQQGTQGVQLKTEVVVRAGQEIGRTQGNVPSGNWDFGLYNLNQDGPLALINAYGMSRNAVCWVDYYIPEKKNLYLSLLEGPRSVCDF